MFDVAHVIALTESPYTIVEPLIRPVLQSFFKNCLHADYAEAGKHLHFSNNAIASRIKELSCDVEGQLVRKLKTTRFAVQFDESKARNNRTYLIGFCRYIDPQSSLIETDFLCCLNLPTASTAQAVYQAI